MTILIILYKRYNTHVESCDQAFKRAIGRHVWIIIRDNSHHGYSYLATQVPLYCDKKIWTREFKDFLMRVKMTLTLIKFGITNRASAAVVRLWKYCPRSARVFLKHQVCFIYMSPCGRHACLIKLFVELDINHNKGKASTYYWSATIRQRQNSFEKVFFCKETTSI